jgi:hypothetical protein
MDKMESGEEIAATGASSLGRQLEYDPAPKRARGRTATASGAVHGA